MTRNNGMAEAWAAARRFLAVVAFALVLAALLEEAETLAHIQSTFLHLLVIPVAAIVSIVLVHGMGIFERFGF